MRSKRFLTGLLVFSLLWSFPALPVHGEEGLPAERSTETTEGTTDSLDPDIFSPQNYIETIVLTSPDDLLELAANCRLDSWSQKRLIRLEQDIDLTGLSFSGIPTFGGTWDGNGHTIRGLELTVDGDVRGFFRYLQATAIVADLHIEGTVQPEGSSRTLGGIAGTNAGRIYRCSFSGSVSGTDQIGGIVGCNEVSGIVEFCKAGGTIQGSHYIGGLAGDNHGVIRHSTNHASVNTTASENTISIEDITPENLSNTEAFYAATDMGGIAGASSGVIRSCVNYGSVGYQSMSYNAGGIAGSLTGYLADCENYGTIQARKDVGGITGQLEPNHVLNYSVDTLQILKSQMGSLNTLANKTGSHAEAAGKQISSQLNTLQSQSSDTLQALQILMETYKDQIPLPDWDMELPDIDGEFPDLDIQLPDPDDLPTDAEELRDALEDSFSQLQDMLPDPDTILAAQNDLSSNLNHMAGTLDSLTSSIGNSSSTLVNDLQDISAQMDQISSTLSDPEEHLGVTLIDISDLDTDEDTISKISSCTNYGPVIADLNGGGIVGSMAPENDLHPEDDITSSGDSSLHFSYETRAVTRDCQNHGSIQVKKRNAGGIVGIMGTGVVLDCVNTGNILASGASQTGGIAGSSSTIIRRCHNKCAIHGSSQVGGIAGIGSTVTDCLSLTDIHGSGPELGAVLGSSQSAMSLQTMLTEGTRTISGNLYLPVGHDPGAIDGISYDGCAQALSLDDFLSLEYLPDLYKTMTLRFVCEDRPDIVFQVSTGDAFDTSRIPPVPQKASHDGHWEGLEQADFSCILFDLTFNAVYDRFYQTLQTEQTRENGLPVVLAEGSFPTDSELILEASDASVDLAEGAVLLESWRLRSDSETPLVVHYLPGADAPRELLEVYILDATGSWNKREHSTDDSYLIFSMEEKESTFCVVRIPRDMSSLFLAGAGAAVLILFAAALLLRKKRVRKPAAAK